MLTESGVMISVVDLRRLEMGKVVVVVMARVVRSSFRAEDTKEVSNCPPCFGLAALSWGCACELY